MMETIKYCSNKAPHTTIAKLLWACDECFIPPLSSRVTIDKYAEKIVHKAVRFEAWSGETLVGLVAVYCNNQEGCSAYITNVSILPQWTKRRIATNLLNRCISCVREIGMKEICLEVNRKNIPAIELYKKCRFRVEQLSQPNVKMTLALDTI